MIDIDIYRRFTVGDATIGHMELNGEQFCVTLEDLPRNTKVPGKTCIPAGRFPLKQRKVVSGLTEHYRSRYPWFKWHLELQDVPEFKYVYIHIGNKAADTDGCILVGRGHLNGRPFITSSTETYHELYEIITAELGVGEQVWVNIYDETD